MIQYFDTQTHEKYIDVQTLMQLLNTKKTEAHRLVQTFKVNKIKYKNRFLLDLTAVKEILKGFGSEE